MKLAYTLTLFLALCASLTSAHLAPPCPAETPTPPPHVNPPVVIPTPPPHVNPPVVIPTPPPHVNPPVNPPTPPPHVNPPVVIPTPPPHVNPPVNPPTPPPHVNPPVNPPAVVRAPICNSADVSFVAENPSSTSTCGSPRTFFLRNAGNCTLSTGGALICDNNRLNCVPCTSITPAGTGFNIVCPTLGITGSQIITDTYQLGVLEGTIATAINVQCPAPFTTPVTPPPPHTPVPCDSNSVSFQLNGPFTCGGAFTATLTTTTSCSLSSGGALVCDSDNRNCISCPATATNNVVTYHCLAKTTGGAQIVTSTYQVGNFIGTIARSQDFGCPSK